MCVCMCEQVCVPTCVCVCWRWDGGSDSMKNMHEAKGTQGTQGRTKTVIPPRKSGVDELGSSFRNQRLPGCCFPPIRAKRGGAFTQKERRKDVTLLVTSYQHDMTGSFLLAHFWAVHTQSSIKAAAATEGNHSLTQDQELP